VGLRRCPAEEELKKKLKKKAEEEGRV